MNCQTRVALALALVHAVTAPRSSAGEAPFLVTAVWEKASATAPAAVALRFVADAPDLRVNRVPAPRLEWPPQLRVEPAPAPSAPSPAADGDPQYLADAEAYRLHFAAAPAKGPVEGRVVFFYCSKNAGWCKKGIAPVSFVLP